MSGRQRRRGRSRLQERIRTGRRVHWIRAVGLSGFLAAFLSCGDGGPAGPTAPAAPVSPPSPPPPPEPTGITLTVDPPSVREDLGPATVTVTATLVGGTTTAETPVVLTTGDGTATGDDYSATATALTIGAGAASGTATVTVRPIDDSRLEGTETFVLRGSAGELPVAEVEIAIVDPPVEVFFAASRIDVREGETRELVVRYQVADLPAPWNAELSFLPETASEADFRTSGTAVHIPAGRIATGEIAVPVTAVSDLLFDEGEETLMVAFVPPSGASAPRPKLGGDMVIAIAEAARSACRGIGFDSTRPRRRSGGILQATLSVEVPADLGSLSADWVGPYYDDDADPENRSRSPQLEVNVADWRVETSAGMTRHRFDLEWPQFTEVELRFYTGDGACDLRALVCGRSGCREGS